MHRPFTGEWAPGYEPRACPGVGCGPILTVRSERAKADLDAAVRALNRRPGVPQIVMKSGIPPSRPERGGRPCAAFRDVAAIKAVALRNCGPTPQAMMLSASWKAP